MLKKIFLLCGMALIGVTVAAGQSNRKPILTCEGNIFFHLDIRGGEIAKSTERIYAIARLGDGEHSPMVNRVRLQTIKETVSEITGGAERLVVAQGERIKGYGGVEIYLGSKFLYFLKANRGAYLVLQCCECNWRTPILKNGKRNPLQECP